MSVSDFNLLTGSSSPLLASGDVLAFCDVSDATQAAQGSTVKATLTQFFAALPVPVNITSASAVSLAVGRLGSTTPAFTVDSSTASQVAGLKVTGAATGGTVALVVTDSGANANVTFNAKGSGTLGIQTVATGNVTLGAIAITVAGAVSGITTLAASRTYTLTDTADESGLVLSMAHASYASSIVQINTSRAANAAFNHILAQSNSVTQFSVTGAGVVTSAGAINGVTIVAGAVSGITTLAGTGAISGFTTLALSSSLTMSGGAILPKKVTLTYGANIAINAALGNVFYCDITNNTAYNVNTPTNPTDGQSMILILYASGGSGAGAGTFTTGASGAFGYNPALGSIATDAAHVTQWTYNSDLARWLPTLFASALSVT